MHPIQPLAEKTDALLVVVVTAEEVVVTMLVEFGLPVQTRWMDGVGDMVQMLFGL